MSTKYVAAAAILATSTLAARPNLTHLRKEILIADARPAVLRSPIQLHDEDQSQWRGPAGGGGFSKGREINFYDEEEQSLWHVRSGVADQVGIAPSFHVRSGVADQVGIKPAFRVRSGVADQVGIQVMDEEQFRVKPTFGDQIFAENDWTPGAPSSTPPLFFSLTDAIKETSKKIRNLVAEEEAEDEAQILPLDRLGEQKRLEKIVGEWKDIKARVSHFHKTAQIATGTQIFDEEEEQFVTEQLHKISAQFKRATLGLQRALQAKGLIVKK